MMIVRMMMVIGVDNTMVTKILKVVAYFIVLQLDLQIQKKAAAWFTLPCIAQLGSCNYQDICPFLEKIDCPPFFEKYGIPCKCPIAAVRYASHCYICVLLHIC